MTHIDGTSSTWDCCGAWECVCGIPDPMDMPDTKETHDEQ